MNSAKNYIILFLLGILTYGLNLQAQENYAIKRVNFSGNKTLDKSFLLDKMAVDEVSFLQKYLTEEEHTLYSKELMELDIQRLKKTYQSEGFVNANVQLDTLKINDKKKSVKINYLIDEKEPYTVDTVIIKLEQNSTGLNVDSIAEKNIRHLTLVKNARFRDEALKEDISSIRNIFLNLGHAYAEVNYELGLDTVEKIVAVTYVVSPGPVCSFGETTIVGNDKVAEAFIRKQLGYEQGKIYNKSFLDKTREALYHLQLFRVVSVLPQKNATTLQNPIPVKIYVEEAPKINSKFGAGYGTEDKFRAFVDFSYLGFLGTARRINLYAKHSALEPYYLSLKWTQPQLFNKKGSVSINPFIGSNAEPGYKTQTYGLNLPLTYNFNSRLNSTLAYYLEKVEQKIEEGDPEFPGREEREYLYDKSGVLLSTVFVTAKPKFSPEQGVNLSLGVKLNGYVFGGSFNYMRFWTDFRTYHDIGNWVLALRLMGGSIHSSDDDGFIPVEDRFYSGGSNSIRGWNRSQLGPKRESGSPLGGKSILEGNIEFRYPLFWKVSGVAFFETGNVWKEAFTYPINDLAYATGGGIRIETPIGPVRFDVGVPLQNEKKSAQFFISVGQAF